MTWTEVALLALFIATVLALLEWRLHRSSRATVNAVKVAVTEAVKAGVSEGVAEAYRATRELGPTVDALSEHIGMLDDEMSEVMKALRLDRKQRAAQALRLLESGIPTSVPNGSGG